VRQGSWKAGRKSLTERKAYATKKLLINLVQGNFQWLHMAGALDPASTKNKAKKRNTTKLLPAKAVPSWRD
jgi:hypothetical protein